MLPVRRFVLEEIFFSATIGVIVLNMIVKIYNGEVNNCVIVPTLLCNTNK